MENQSDFKEKKIFSLALTWTDPGTIMLRDIPPGRGKQKYP